ncbi:unnamed protein product [Acanthoscelides obtectus]|uniref:TACO1/YebC-like second and third domain-containing protein n=1 Tax=Acanthoscelides obtectus TaxID=200917 RepID=A0A9P0KNC9_ACAOB|nr:unnamed protein product [Acanthoscelides obtectus]CAK1655802.1 Translational activator of cytochrome c oxidase 1 [Acanthoscelides obtectus]
MFQDWSGLEKYSFQYGDGGGQHLFKEKGVIIAELEESGTSEDELLEIATSHAIESGAEDVTVVDNVTARFICDIPNLQEVAGSLERQGYMIVSANQEWVAVRLHQLADTDLTVVDALYRKLEALSEVTQLADNIA